jgi:hypothetical protein
MILIKAYMIQPDYYADTIVEIIRITAFGCIVEKRGIILIFNTLLTPGSPLCVMAPGLCS